MSDGKDKLKSVMCDGEWWSLKDLSRAIKKSKEETKARIVELVKAGELKIQGKTKDRVYRLQTAVREETIKEKKAAAPKPAKAKPKARPAPPPPVHEHEWHASKDGYRKCGTCNKEEYQVKGEWVESPMTPYPSKVPKEQSVVTPPPTSCGRAYLDALGHAAKPKPASPPASPPEAEGNYCIQCGIEILQRERCDECAQHPIAVGKVAILCPTCKAPAVIEWKQGTSHVELTGRCERCGLFQTAMELPPLTPPPR